MTNGSTGRRVWLAVAALSAMVGLSGCYYGPAPYYPTATYAYPGYAPAYAYAAPPVVVGGYYGYGWHHHYWR